MMKIQKFVCNMFQENCYVVSDDSQQCVIIDCGALYPEEGQAIISYIKDANLTPVHLLSTHGHFDHNCGTHNIYQHFGIAPEISSQDEKLINNLVLQAQSLANIQYDVPATPVSHFFKDGEVIEFGTHKLEVVATPGHTRGSVCFLCRDEKVMFSGDTLFRHSIGRTDLQGGSMLQIIQSLRMMAQMPDDIKVLPGHGESTSIGEELAHNPYMDR